jgi:UDP-GlcNAc:undecaprenyl-phosphate GlcNAc-1-phosphate transferase
MITIIESNKQQLLMIISCLVFLNIIFLIFYKKIAIFINIFDKKKIHRDYKSNDTPAIGGVLFFINFFLFILLLLLFDFQLLFLKEIGIKTTFLTFLGFILIFCIGLLDDKFDLRHNIKIILFLFICYLPLAGNDSFVINNLSISFLSKEIQLDKVSFLFSLLAIFTFINIFNMYDGVNAQSGVYILIASIYLILTKSANLFIIPLITFCIFFLFLNYRGKIFLGNNGSYLVSYFLSLMIIWGYKNNSELNADSIYLLMSFPFLDMIRLFLVRICNGKSPFVADSNHFHHIVLNKFNNNIFIVNLNSLTQVVLPLLVYYILSLEIFAIFLSIFIYFLSFLLLKNK